MTPDRHPRPAIRKDVAWVKANQRASSRWFTRSLNNDKAHYITNTGTAYCVPTLDACGEKVGFK